MADKVRSFIEVVYQHFRVKRDKVTTFRGLYLPSETYNVLTKDSKNLVELFEGFYRASW